MASFIKKFDIFGNGFNLTFKGNDTYLSSIGGILGIITYVLMLLYTG